MCSQEHIWCLARYPPSLPSFLSQELDRILINLAAGSREHGTFVTIGDQAEKAADPIQAKINADTLAEVSCTESFHLMRKLLSSFGRKAHDSLVAHGGRSWSGPDPKGGGALRTPKLLHGTMCFVGARDFV